MTIRGALLFLIMGVLCPLALFNPRLGIIGYTWFALMRPDYLAWMYEQYPFSMVLAICTLVGSIRLAYRVTAILTSPICWVLIAFVAVQGLSVLAARNVAIAWAPYKMYLQLIIMAMLIPLLIDDLKHLKWLLFAIAFSIGFLGLRFGAWGTLQGGVQIVNPYGGFISDNNSLALALTMCLPLLWHCAKLAERFWMRTGFWTMMAGTMIAVIFTHSRGGLLAAVAAVGMIAFRSRHRVLIAGCLVAMMLPAVQLVRESFVTRMGTMTISLDQQTDLSILSRTELARTALRMWQANPVLGVGFGANNFVAAMPAYSNWPWQQVAHNTYLQVLADSGTLAGFLYIVLLFGTILWCGRSGKRMKRLQSPLQAIPFGIEGALVTFSVGAVFLSRVSFDFVYILIMTAAAWYPLEKEWLARRAAETEQAELAAAAPPAMEPPGTEPVGTSATPRRSRLARRL